MAGEQLEQRDLLTSFLVTNPGDLPGAAGTLREAIIQANSTPGPDRIEFLGVSGVQLEQGQVVITDSLEIDGSTAPGGQVTIHANLSPNPLDRIFLIDDSSPAHQTVTMNNLRLIGGVAPDGGAILNREDLTLREAEISGNTGVLGGGLANFGFSRLDDVTLYGNSATYLGGGVFNVGTIEILNSHVLNNNATAPAGGIAYGGGVHNEGAAVFVDSQVISNAANRPVGGAAHGGGISTRGGAIVDLIDTDVLENHADDFGGGAFVTHGAGLIAQLNSNIFANDASDSGGGIYLSESAHGDIIDSSVSYNLSELRGGGIVAGGGVQLNLTNTTVDQNSTQILLNDGSGGGLYLGDPSGVAGPVVNIENSFIRRNNQGFGPTPVALGELGGGMTVGPGSDVTIENTVISENSASRSGGGIYATDGFLPGAAPQITINGSQVLSNEAGSQGGGLAMFRGTLDVDSSEVSRNQTGADGGGLFLSGLGGSGLVATIRDSVISGNSAKVNGGGINAGPQQQLTLENTEVSYNEVYGRGAGLYLTQQGAPSFPLDVTIQGSSIRQNRATFDATGTSDAFAGGIWAAYLAQVQIEATTIDNNQADSVGGGLVANGTSALTLQDSTVSGNATGLHGGGAYLLNTSATLEQTTFYGNRAYLHGGGLFVYSAVPNRVAVDHSTIATNFANQANSTARGGGIFIDDTPANQASVELDHSVVARNFAGLVPNQPVDISDGGGQLAATFSFVGINTGTTLPAGNPAPQGNIVGTHASPRDPGLGPLTFNGGPTLTMQPDPASLLINAGDPNFLPPPLRDQRQGGHTRVFNGRIDMGAVEVQPPPPLVDVDFNGDGTADCADADALAHEIVAGTNLASFDLTGDGLVDHADFTQWLDDAPFYNGVPIQHYLPADANLDGSVDGQDFVIWNAHKFTTNANWCDGDFNIDGVIDGQDFILWNLQKFQSSPPCPGGVPCRPVPVDTMPESDARVEIDHPTPDRGTSLNPEIADLAIRSVSRPSEMGQDDRVDEETLGELAVQLVMRQLSGEV